MAKSSQNTDLSNDVPSTKRGLKEGYNRVTFIVREEITYELNCISSFEQAFLKDVVNQALEAYVAEWKKNNPNKKIPKWVKQ
jgi:hypothetical protein